MEKIILKPLAKINLGLDIIGVREDGYHEMRMIMQSLALHDQMVMQITDENRIRLKTNVPYLPTDAGNIVYKAVDMIRNEYGIEGGVRIDLKKTIPIAAGLGGGSSDAAAAIYGMNKLFGLGLRKSDMIELGTKLGADVPFCIMRGTMLAEGIGEELSPVAPMVDCPVLVVKPNFGVSTKDVYTAYDKCDKCDLSHPNIDGLCEALKNQDFNSICANMGNVLEGVTIKMHPEVQIIKDELMSKNAKLAMMSGSGPTVFALFDDKVKAQSAYHYFKDIKGYEQTFLTDFYCNSKVRRKQ